MASKRASPLDEKYKKTCGRIGARSVSRSLQRCRRRRRRQSPSRLPRCSHLETIHSLPACPCLQRLAPRHSFVDPLPLPAMYFSKIFVVLAAVAAASAMTTHFGRRDFHHHRRAVVAREPELVTETPVQVVPRPRKRANGRCKASSSAAPAASSAAAANAGNDPPTFTSTAVEQTTAQQTTAAAPTEEPTTKASPTTHAPTTTHTTAASTPTSGSGSSGSSSGSSDGETHSGDGKNFHLLFLDACLFVTFMCLGTFYATGLGSCGITNHDTDYIAAVSHILYDSFA